MKTILVPLDLSPGSEGVCRAACRIVRRGGGRVVLLHVVNPPPVNLNSFGFATAQIRGMEAELSRRATRSLLALGRKCERLAGGQVQVVQRTGDTVPTILAKAASLKADLIVLGSHGHTAAYDLLIGSTTQAVLRRSSRPVLVVPATSA